MEILKANLVFNQPLAPLDLSKVQYIILHHPEAISATPDEIHQWHLEKGWSGAGYNEYVRKDGTVYIMRGDNIGAQCKDYNSISYGICAEGNYDIEKTMPLEQLNSLIQRIQFNKARFKNYKKIVPHKEFVNTNCPGRYFPLSEILKRIEGANMSFDEAILFLFREGCLNNQEYRRKVCDVVLYEKDFVINCANKIFDLKNQLERK